MENKSEIAAMQYENIEAYRGTELDEALKGLRVTFGAEDFFTMSYDEESCDIVIADPFGWSMRYPALTKDWTVFAAWLTDWNDDNKDAAVKLFQCIIYPTCMRVADIDVEYLNAVLEAHVGAVERIDGMTVGEDGNLKPVGEEETPSEEAE